MLENEKVPETTPLSRLPSCFQSHYATICFMKTLIKNVEDLRWLKEGKMQGTVLPWKDDIHQILHDPAERHVFPLS